MLIKKKWQQLNTIAAAFNRGIGSVKNSTFKNPTGLKSYETKEIN